MPAKDIEEDDASWICPRNPGIQEVMIILINLKEEQKNPSSILGGIGLNTSCSAVILM